MKYFKKINKYVNNQLKWESAIGNNFFLPAINSCGARRRCGVEKLRKTGKGTLDSLAGFNKVRIAKIICWFNSKGDSIHR